MAKRFNIKSLFLEEEAPKETPKAEERQNVSTTPAPSSETSLKKINITQETSIGNIDQKMLERLEEKLSSENIPGPDYLELKETAMDKESVEIEPDERKRYRQAFANMKRFFPQAGITKDKILGSIDHYINIMEDERKDAISALNNKRSVEIDQAEREVASEKEEVEKLKLELQKREAALNEKLSTINSKREDFNTKEKNFNATLDFMVGILNEDRKKLNEYLND